MDLYSESKRSEIMAKVGGKNTKPEILVRKFLFANSFRYRLNDKRYPGKPDILLPKYKTAIFINGCFWHGHDCPAGRLPSTRMDFWETKINANKARDKKVIAQLESLGLRVITIWQCELKNIQLINHTLNDLLLHLRNMKFQQKISDF